MILCRLGSVSPPLQYGLCDFLPNRVWWNWNGASFGVLILKKQTAVLSLLAIMLIGSPGRMERPRVGAERFIWGPRGSQASPWREDAFRWYRSPAVDHSWLQISLAGALERLCGWRHAVQAPPLPCPLPRPVQIRDSHSKMDVLLCEVWGVCYAVMIAGTVSITV